MKIENIHTDIKDLLRYIIRYNHLLKIDDLIEKTEFLAKSFNQHHYGYIVAPNLIGPKYKEMPAQMERYLRKLANFTTDTLLFFQEIIDKIDDERQRLGI